MIAKSSTRAVAGCGADHTALLDVRPVAAFNYRNLDHTDREFPALARNWAAAGIIPEIALRLP